MVSYGVQMPSVCWYRASCWLHPHRSSYTDRPSNTWYTTRYLYYQIILRHTRCLLHLRRSFQRAWCDMMWGQFRWILSASNQIRVQEKPEISLTRKTPPWLPVHKQLYEKTGPWGDVVMDRLTVWRKWSGVEWHRTQRNVSDLWSQFTRPKVSKELLNPSIEESCMPRKLGVEHHLSCKQERRYKKHWFKYQKFHPSAFETLDSIVTLDLVSKTCDLRRLNWIIDITLS